MSDKARAYGRCTRWPPVACDLEVPVHEMGADGRMVVRVPGFEYPAVQYGLVPCGEWDRNPNADKGPPACCGVCTHWVTNESMERGFGTVEATMNEPSNATQRGGTR